MIDIHPETRVLIFDCEGTIVETCSTDRSTTLNATLKPINPTLEIIEKYENKLPMVLLSSGSRNTINTILNQFNILHAFDFIITADENYPNKNSPQGFVDVANHLNVDCPKCHVFDDNILCLINALRANMMITDMRTINH